MSTGYVSLQDMGFELFWLKDSALFEVKFNGEYWGHIDMRPSAMEALSRESKLMDIYYGRVRIPL